MKVLFICTGNTCRSPMCEGYLKSKNIQNLTVISKGLTPQSQTVSENSKIVMKEIGIDISRHISSCVTMDDTKNCDKIICLSHSHYDFLLNTGIDKNKLFVLSNGISDPFGGDLSVYRKCRDEIITAIDNLIKNNFFSDFQIVPLDLRHIKAIAKLERVCFSEPWSEEGIIDSFKAGTKFFVAEQNNKTLGYVGISAIIDEGYITNVAVFESARKKGVGTALLNKIFQFANEKRLLFVSLEVRESNCNAISLYKKLKFIEEGKRKNFYRNPLENALIMTRRFEYSNENT